MTLDLYAAVSRLASSFAHFLIGLLKILIIGRLFLLFFVRYLRLEYMAYNESVESEGEESEKPGYESGSDGTCGNRLGGLLHGV